MSQRLPEEFFKNIGTFDLSYKDPKGKYQCHYKVSPFRNKNIISVTNIGTASVEDLLEEFKIVDRIILTAKTYLENLSFIIKYDSRNINIPSIKVRKLYFQKVNSLIKEGLIEHTAYIENRKTVLAFSKVFIQFFKNLNYSIHSNETEADKRIAFLCYKKDITETKQLIKEDISLLKSITFPEWTYSLPDNKFTIHAALLGDNILYAKAKGILNEETLKITYAIYKKVIEFNGGKVEFSIIDMHKVSSISRNARKVFEGEHEYIAPLWGKAFCILPSFGMTLYKLYQKFKPKSVKSFHVVNNFETAFKLCQGIPQTSDFKNENTEPTQKSYAELEAENKALKEKIESFEQVQKQKIELLINTLGGITWNDNLTLKRIQKDENDAFYDLYETTWILQNDIQEILQAEKADNEKLSQLVSNQTAALKDKEYNLRNIINFSDKIIWLVDKDFKLLEANNLFFNYFRKAQKTDIQIGDHFFEALKDGNLKNKLKKWFDHALTGKNAIYESENEINDITVVHEYNILPVVENGKIEAISIRVIDITSKKRAEQKLQEQNEALRKVNSELDHFVYSVSHDLRAPLTSLMGLIDITKTETQLDIIQQYNSLKEKSVKKLDSFIQDIIHLSRNARTEVKAEKIELELFVDGILSDLQYAKNSDSVEIIIDIKQQVPLFTDANRIKVILSNLISNGLRYADLRKERPYISISAQVTDKEASIKVADNGQGIKTEHQPKIFDMFYRANSHQNGSGLGLYILNESLKKINGHITLESEYGMGTSFTIRFPQTVVNKVPSLSKKSWPI